MKIIFVNIRSRPLLTVMRIFDAAVYTVYTKLPNTDIHLSIDIGLIKNNMGFLCVSGGRGLFALWFYAMCGACAIPTMGTM